MHSMFLIMTAIRRYVLISLVFLCAILGLFAAMFLQVKSAFLTNVYLNGAIFALFIFGIGYNVWLFLKLKQEAVWFSFFEKGRDHESSAPKPKALRPLQQLFQARPTSFTLQATFGSIQNRFDETRDINRYITGLLVFMGLLGTFWGLAHTVTAISGVIASIDLQAGDIQDAFKTLKEGLRAPLTGMGTAFSSSLFGLLGSLIIGFLDVQYGKAIQSLFYFIEERVHLSSINAGAGIDGQMMGQTYSQSIFEQAAESMQLLAQQLQRGEESRQVYLRNFAELSEKLSLLVDQQNQQLTALQTVSQGQFNIQNLITRQTETAADITKYSRSLDSQIARINDEITTGRQQLTREICEEIRTVSRILAALSEGHETPR